MEKLWKYKKIGEVCIVERGASPRPIDKYITDNESGINWIKIGDTSDSMYITETAQKIIVEGMKKSRYVKPGDFLLSNSMSFGRPYILKIDGCIHDGWLVLRDENALFDKRFLYYYLSSKTTYKKLKSMAVGGVVNNLNSEMVRNVIVPVPDKEEQSEIADLFDKIKKILDDRKQELEQLDTLVKSRFVEMFGDIITGKYNYKIRKLGDVAFIGSSYRVFTTEFVESGIPFYRGTEIGELANGIEPSEPYYISEEHYNKLTKNKKEHIKQGEVKAVLEKSKQDDENMFQDKHVYLKTATGMCKFAIKKEVKEVLFVAQQSDIIRILVMNNSDFDMLRSLQKKNTVIMTQQTEKETAIDEGKLKVCEKKYEIIGFYKGSLMKEDRQDDLTTLIFYICIGAFLIISGIMILSIKIWSDISNVSMKYGFLKKIGMETKEIKKNVKKELSLSLWIAFILSIVISGGALSYITWNVDWLLKKQVLITFFALLLFQAGYIILLREYGWRLANQQIQSERREKIWK